MAFLKPVILCRIHFHGFKVDFLEFSGIVEGFSAMLLRRGQQEKQTRKPRRNHVGVFRDARECTIQQGKAVEGGEIPRFHGKRG